LKPLSLLSKLFLAQVFLVLLATSIVGYLGRRSLEQLSVEETEHSLQEQVFLVEEIVRTHSSAGSFAGLEGRLSALGRSSGIRYTVVAADGKVLADSAVASRLMENHAGRPEIQEAHRTRESATVIRRSTTVGKLLMYLARPMTLEPDRTIFLRVAKPLASIGRGWRRLFLAILVGAIVIMVLSSLLGYWFSRRITDPLRGMTSVAGDIAAGDFTHEVDVRNLDEVGELGRAINTMTRQLSGRMETIQNDRNKLVAILGSLFEGVVAVDEDERVLHLNHVAADLLDVDELPEGWIGERVWELTRVREACDILSRSMEDKKELSEELVLPGWGVPKVLVLRARPILDKNRSVVGAVLVIHDRTEESRFENVRRDFVANVSHELKTPLTAIRGYVETMVDDEDMPSEVRGRFLHRVQGQAQRLSSLVTDLLALSRLESREEDQDFQLLDLREVARESIRELSTRAEEKELQLEQEMPEERLPVFGDPEALRQLIDNLLSNAINYTPRGGWVRIRLVSAKDRVLLEVEDGGVGIAAKDLDRVFERFFRVDKARSRELGGTGLGLAIVKHVARSHQGEVSVESELGRGSRFRVSLPAASQVARDG